MLADLLWGAISGALGSCTAEIFVPTSLELAHKLAGYCTDYLDKDYWGPSPGCRDSNKGMIGIEISDLAPQQFVSVSNYIDLYEIMKSSTRSNLSMCPASITKGKYVIKSREIASQLASSWQPHLQNPRSASLSAHQHIHDTGAPLLKTSPTSINARPSILFGRLQPTITV